jgi:hypothetical protein
MSLALRVSLAFQGLQMLFGATAEPAQVFALDQAPQI